MRPLLALLVVAVGTWAQAQSRVEPAKGAFLVARPRIEGGPFYRSVVLLLTHGEDGTLGVIVNRPTELLLENALPDLDVGEVAHHLYFGGPVALQGLLVLFENETPPEGAETVMPGVWFSGDKNVLARLVKQNKQADELRVFIGHSGWAPHQLDAELREGSWDVLRADVFTLFRAEPEYMWEDLTGAGATIARSSGALLPFARTEGVLTGLDDQCRSNDSRPRAQSTCRGASIP